MASEKLEWYYCISFPNFSSRSSS